MNSGKVTKSAQIKMTQVFVHVVVRIVFILVERLMRIMGSMWMVDIWDLKIQMNYYVHVSIVERVGWYISTD